MENSGHVLAVMVKLTYVPRFEKAYTPPNNSFAKPWEINPRIMNLAQDMNPPDP